MSENDRAEDAGGTTPPEPPVPTDVQARLAEIQRRRGGRIRWRISRHTAEMTIRALEEVEQEGAAGARRPSSKSRRRKRKSRKRLL